MSEIPSDRRYTKDHEWVRVQGDGTVRVGITDYAQAALGDLVFVELPGVDDTTARGDACAVVESVKAASDVYAPVGGTVTAVNTALVDAPELINSDPYGDGWLVQLRPDVPGELETLLACEDYERLLVQLGEDA